MATNKGVRSSLLTIGLAYLAFISIGLPDGLLGVAWPSIRGFFQLQFDAIGPLLIMFTTGYLFSAFSCGWLMRRLNVGALLALSCLITAVSLIGYSLSPFWAVIVILAALAGFGAGAIDAGLNTYASLHFSPRVVSWLHAFYGVGATGGPLIMTAVLNNNRPWQLGYAIVGVSQLLLAIAFGITHSWWQDKRTKEIAAATQHKPVTSITATLRLPVVWLSIAVFFFYTGVEAATGTWIYSLFTEARQIDPARAGIWVSIYWGSLTIGRIISGVIVNHLKIAWLLRGCLIGLILGATLLWLNINNGVSFFSLSLMGLSLAPIFPLMIATTPKRLTEEHNANGIGFQIAAATCGASMLPALLGLLVDIFKLEVIGIFLFCASMLLLILIEIVDHN